MDMIDEMGKFDVSYCAYEQVSLKCTSHRDQYFMCETHEFKRKCTLPNGRCYTKNDYTEQKVLNHSST